MLLLIAATALATSVLAPILPAWIVGVPPAPVADLPLPRGPARAAVRAWVRRPGDDTVAEALRLLAEDDSDLGRAWRAELVWDRDARGWEAAADLASTEPSVDVPPLGVTHLVADWSVLARRDDALGRHALARLAEVLADPRGAAPDPEGAVLALSAAGDRRSMLRRAVLALAAASLGDAEPIVRDALREGWEPVLSLWLAARLARGERFAEAAALAAGELGDPTLGAVAAETWAEACVFAGMRAPTAPDACLADLPPARRAGAVGALVDAALRLHQPEVALAAFEAADVLLTPDRGRDERWLATARALDVALVEQRYRERWGEPPPPGSEAYDPPRADHADGWRWTAPIGGCLQRAGAHDLAVLRASVAAGRVTGAEAPDTDLGRCVAARLGLVALPREVEGELRLVAVRLGP